MSYVRRNAQNLPVIGDVALDRLGYDKGIRSLEDDILMIAAEQITNATDVIEFMLDAIPTGEPDDWLSKQRVLINKKPTVASVLLISDNPQSILAKRSAIKSLRYQTKTEAEHDFLVFDQNTIEAPIYSLIYDTVDRVKEIIEGIEKIGPSGMEKINYQEKHYTKLLLTRCYIEIITSLRTYR